MSSSTLIRIAGVLGGLCWVVLWPATPERVGTQTVDALYWAGAALLAIALIGIGAGLVSGLMALRVVVALCFPLLVWAILEALHESVPDRGVDAVFGAAVAVLCLVALLRGRPRTRAGSHVRE